MVGDEVLYMSTKSSDADSFDRFKCLPSRWGWKTGSTFAFSVHLIGGSACSSIKGCIGPHLHEEGDKGGWQACVPLDWLIRGMCRYGCDDLNESP